MPLLEVLHAKLLLRTRTRSREQTYRLRSVDVHTRGLSLVSSFMLFTIMMLLYRPFGAVHWLMEPLYSICGSDISIDVCKHTVHVAFVLVSPLPRKSRLLTSVCCSSCQ